MEITSHSPGTPCWVDLGTSDVEASKKFYSKLFGWQYLDYGPEAQGYMTVTLRDKAVAGMGPAQRDDVPPYWTTYIASDDVDTTAKSVDAAGGQVIVPPMEIMNEGRMAVFMDNAGAMFSVWQPHNHIGAELGGEPGALTWNDLNTRDAEKAKAFYGAVFGWTAVQQPQNPSYFEWYLDDRMIAGMFVMGDDMGDMPPCWMTYFGVEDCDAAIETIQSMGGQLHMGPMDIEPGRMAVVADPQGAVFDIIALNMPA